MRRILLCILCIFPLTGSLVAQDDPMALQRCIWRCLAAFPGASNPAYHQCVDRSCIAQPQFTTPVSDWQNGIATDGRHRFATTQAEQGMAFTYFCVPGQSYFVLTEVPVPPGQYRMLIGNVDYVVTFDLSRGVLSADIPPENVFMQAVRLGGDMVRIRTMQGAAVLQFSLRGANENIGQAIAGCAG